MKITLNLTNDQILMVFNILKNLETAEPTLIPLEKLNRSLLWEAYDRFTTIKKKIVKQENIFDQNTKRKVILKYYEAYALQIILFDLEPVTDVYFKTILQKIVDDLNQKLA